MDIRDTFRTKKDMKYNQAGSAWGEGSSYDPGMQDAEDVIEGEAVFHANLRNMQKVYAQQQADKRHLERKVYLLDWQKRTFNNSVSKERSKITLKLERFEQAKKRAQAYSHYIRHEVSDMKPYLVPLTPDEKREQIIREVQSQIEGPIRYSLSDLVITDELHAKLVANPKERIQTIMDEIRKQSKYGLPDVKPIRLHSADNKARAEPRTQKPKFSSDRCISKYSFYTRNAWEARQIRKRARERQAWGTEHARDSPYSPLWSPREPTKQYQRDRENTRHVRRLLSPSEMDISLRERRDPIALAIKVISKWKAYVYAKKHTEGEKEIAQHVVDRWRRFVEAMKNKRGGKTKVKKNPASNGCTA